MSYDGWLIRRLARELDARLVGGVIQKIYQPDNDALVLVIRTRAQNEILFLSRDPEAPRVYLAGDLPNRPGAPSGRTMRFRKHVQNGRITAVRQLGLERIIAFDIEAKDLLGDRKTYTLLIELMGRHANIILIDRAQVIVETVHAVTAEMSRHRQVLPGEPYILPPAQDKLDPLHLDEAAFTARLIGAFPEGHMTVGDFSAWLVQNVHGIGPLFAREIAERAARLGRAPDLDLISPQLAHRAVHRAIRTIEDASERAEIVYAPMRPVFAALTLTHLTAPRETFDTVSDCLTAYFERVRVDNPVQRTARALKQTVLSLRERAVKKIERYDAVLAEAEDAERFRLYGELIFAYQYLIPMAGASQVDVPDPEHPDRTLVIPLDPKLSPAENAKDYFRRYQKLKAAKTAAETQRRRAEAERVHLDSILAHIDYADAQALEEIREELLDAGFIRPSKQPPKPKTKRAPAVERYRSSEGALIFVGKNNVQNDYLTMKLAHPNDLWLHAKNMPGAHVVVRGEHVSDTTLHEAALLAAYFSKGRQSSGVPVDCTLVKNVWKPKGASPGSVLYRGERTLFVTPEPEALKAIFARRVLED
ncbi:MAG: NFACT family protein [Hydrogenibacillus sp.]|nr:NFACT family protein [Hydrogenibacillus sp.]